MEHTTSESKKYNTSSFGQFLVYQCAGKDRNMMKKVPESVWIKYARIGSFVFLTSLLAFCTSAYAIYTIFDNLLIAVGFGALWAFIIFNFDQFLVITTQTVDRLFSGNTLNVLLRLLIGIVIAFTISKPVEVAIFRDKIDKRLSDNTTKEEEVCRSKADKEIKSIRNQLSSNEKILSDQREKIYVEWNGLSTEKGKFSGISGQGPQTRQRKKDYTADSIRFAVYEKTQLNKIKAIEKEKDRELKRIKDKAANGFFARYEVLEEIASESPSIKSANLLIMILFVLVEVSPILAKAFSEKDYYEELLEAEHTEKKVKTEVKKKAYKEYIESTYRNNLLKKLNQETYEENLDRKYIFKSYIDTLLSKIKNAVNEKRINLLKGKGNNHLLDEIEKMLNNFYHQNDKNSDGNKHEDAKKPNDNEKNPQEENKNNEDRDSNTNNQENHEQYTDNGSKEENPTGEEKFSDNHQQNAG
ncbi:DUF4407 domain-containing protein [Chryseobacterium sp. EO14]|uniref:DUF4407 domain-containing protein n=1 Tax=Chryseobacterium sp. EO14 TaxID=2950551 RepID=UPI00210E197B|nr:DUF4407 domain-containing protein [Chryseobacterium sp. EO14]MCQ4141613.1 DUF4407 domain-containing protein [Chryseobacterium sp. EO14]